MSNWICSECGANYIDVSHQEPSVLREELELRKTKEQLNIAVEAMKKIIGYFTPYGLSNTDMFSQLKTIQKDLGITLQRIKELEK